MAFVIANALHCQVDARICIVCPYGRNVELGAQIVDAVQDMCWDLDLDTVLLVGRLLIVVGEGAYIQSVIIDPTGRSICMNAWRSPDLQSSPYQLDSQRPKRW